MQEAAFAAAGLKAYYVALELDARAFHKTLSDLDNLILEGFNITVPYKQVVMRYLDRVTPEARAIGAVNTGYKKGRKWVGANTDVYGFLRALKKEGHFEPRHKTILVFGAGGAARAVLYGLAQSGARKISVSNRHKARAVVLMRKFKKLFPKTAFEVLPEKQDTLKEAIAGADLVVNATSVGLKKTDRLWFPASWVLKAKGKKKLFFDLIYHTRKTPFLNAAVRKGHRVLGGAGMLLFQGARAFEYWTGKKASVPVMRHALLEALLAKERD